MFLQWRAGSCQSDIRRVSEEDQILNSTNKKNDSQKCSNISLVSAKNEKASCNAVEIIYVIFPLKYTFIFSVASVFLLLFNTVFP